VGDRETGVSASVTYWETPESSRQAEERMAEVRGRITAELGIEVLGNEVFEITLLERRQPAQPGNRVRMTTVQGSADAFDAATGDLRERGLALVSTLPGFRALISGVNRETGRFMITSGWDTAADRQASEAATAELREQLLERLQASSVEVENYEVYFAEISARVGVSS
jgi:hypothetical protein